MTDQLKQLSEAATQGEWWPDGDDREGMEWNFHIMHGESDRVCFMSNMGRNRTAESGANAAFIVALVNAYRAGELIPASEARAREAVAYEMAADICHAEITACEAQADDAYGSMERARRDGMKHEAAFLEAGIRALTPVHTTAALEQIRQQARVDAIKEACKHLLANHEHHPHMCHDAAASNIGALIGMSHSETKALATLSADTQENSDGS